ncbi:MAG TPA: GGDEF domain-containing protein, partial [Chroococcales cyanobacterium]
KLVSHRHFQFLLQQEIDRSTRYHHPLSLIMLDIDRFKDINDKNGHQAGDLVLIEVSRILKQSCREVDTVARYGGEEFVLILPETDLTGAALVAERLRNRIENCVTCYQDKVLRITVSLGVTSFPEQANSKESLIMAADKAMYLSKEKGRNRVSVSVN